MERTWHQDRIVSFAPGHVDFTSADACLSEPRPRHKPGLNRRHKPTMGDLEEEKREELDACLSESRSWHKARLNRRHGHPFSDLQA